MSKTKTGAIFITPVLYPGVAFDGLIVSHGRPHVAAVSFSDRKANLDKNIRFISESEKNDRYMRLGRTNLQQRATFVAWKTETDIWA
jgi:hypothetical protein